jgi:hypothetical protein
VRTLTCNLLQPSPNIFLFESGVLPSGVLLFLLCRSYSLTNLGHISFYCFIYRKTLFACISTSESWPRSISLSLCDLQPCIFDWISFSFMEIVHQRSNRWEFIGTECFKCCCSLLFLFSTLVVPSPGEIRDILHSFF